MLPVLWIHILSCLLLTGYSYSAQDRILPTVTSSVHNVIKHDSVGERLYPPNPPATHHILMGIKYFDELLQENQIAEVLIDVYGTVVPKTVENFVEICRGHVIRMKRYKQKPYFTYAGYKHSNMTKVIRGDMIGGGVANRETSFSIHGLKFKDENFFLKHDRPGRLSMLNDGVPDSNDSRFFFSMNPLKASKYDGKNVVFGQVVRGLDMLERLQESVAVDENGSPKHRIEIMYSVVEELVSDHFEDFHADYLERLERYNNGDMSVGYPLQLPEDVIEERKIEEDTILFDSLEVVEHDNPLNRVIIGFIILCSLYLFLKLRKIALESGRKMFKRTTTVSMRD